MNFSDNDGKSASAEQAPSPPARVPVGARAAGPARLTTDGAFKRHPVFWPGGQELIYTVLTPVTQLLPPTGREGRLRLMRMKVANRSVTLFHDLKSGIADRDLTVSADGSVVAYCLYDKIVVEDRQHARRVTIAGGQYQSFLLRPTLSPNGNRIVFMRDNNRLVALDLWKDGVDTVNLWKDGIRDIELGADGDMQPSFSPDGRRIVFTSRRDRDYEIYVMTVDGSEQRRLTNSRGIDMNPVFSPDNRRIAFTSNRDGNYEIYVMDADGRNQRRVTRTPERSDFSCWHPDGKHVVFVGERNGRFDLYLAESPA
jgi:Tol biopolymer transport system component